jgi:quercetin dioxygenase-like cupin family protein
MVLCAAQQTHDIKNRTQELQMFQKKDDNGYIQALEGIERKTLVYGERTLMSGFRLEKGRTLPRHAHPYEQTGYLVSGRMQLSIGEKTFETEPGDSWCIPADAEHGAVILEDSVVIEVFSPVRGDYMPASHKNI